MRARKKSGGWSVGYCSIGGGTVDAERFLRRDEIDRADARRFSKSIGHQHVLEPELRTKKGAHGFAQHLLTKAAERLWRRLLLPPFGSAFFIGCRSRWQADLCGSGRRSHIAY